jgi:hypothetical protein
LLLPCLAALALTVPTGCHRASQRAQVKAKAKANAKNGAARVAVKVQVPVAVAVARFAAVPARPQPVADKAPPVANDRVLASWEKVEGWGPDQEAAVQDALKNARKLVVAELRKQDPPLTGMPSTAYIDKHLVVGPPQRHQEQDQVVAGIPTQCWSISLQLTASRRREMVALDRADRARQRQAEREWRTEHRMRLAGVVTAGLLVLLLAVMAFLRLDDWARGAYTRGLRRLFTASGSGLRSLVCRKRASGGPGV